MTRLKGFCQQLRRAAARGTDRRIVIVHATHWKAGSQWVRAVLEGAQPQRAVPVKDDMSHVTADPIVRGGIYTPVYLPRWVVDESIPRDIPQARFAVIRDLRDTLISWYFSLKCSHSSNEFIDRIRPVLAGLSEEEGLIHLIQLQAGLQPMVDIQTSWLRGPDLVVRYEDMIADEQGQFQRIFEHCRIPVPPRRRREIVREHSFESKAGRRPGVEDPANHRRKGIAGDWQNHFTPGVKGAFKERFGRVLVETGYETGTDW
jgi:hypothetical protein